jgi:DHA1 family bicyclomycin/chloramphenicol resistance-like MFS transporter
MQPPQTASRSAPQAIGFREFVLLTAAIMSCQALAVDAMLPALATIGRELGVTDPNHTQWVITAYIAGVGVGQLFWGVISDRLGRRPVLLIGLALYAITGLLAATADSFSALLTWRVLCGIAASSLVVARSVIRDLYEGRQMARVMSLTFIIFIIMPILAPSIGQLILFLAPWRALFIAFSVFAVGVGLWLLLRLPETLHPEYRMTLTRSHILGSTKRVLTERASLWYTLASAVMFGSIISYVGMVQQIFADIFHKPAWMPTMFALCAAAMGVTSFINSKLVERIGMRIISQVGLLLFIAAASLHTVVAALGFESLWVFVALQAATMGCFGLAAANFGAMAMESMGSVAGIAASLQGAVSTFGGALVAALIGRYYNETTVPLALGVAICGVAALVFVLVAERGRLFRPHH